MFRRMTRAALALLRLALLLHFAFSSRAHAKPSPQDDEVIRVNVQLVQVDAQVVQKESGRAVGSLRKEDFQLYEDGVQQKIAELSRDQLPLAIVLLFDLTE